MNKTYTPLYILIVLISFYPASQTTASEQIHSLTAEIALKRQAHVNAVTAENIEEALQHYADDARLMPEANLTIQGKVNTKEYFTKFFKRFDIQKYNSNSIKTLSMPGYLLDIGTFHLAMKNGNGDLRTLTGKYADLWQQKENGELSLITAIWNYNHWPDFEGELQFKSPTSVRTSFGQQVPLINSASLELEAYGLLNTAAVLQRDSKILSNMYSEDGILMPNYHTTITGREHIYTYWVKHATELPMFEKLDNSTDKIIDLGEYIIQFASHLAIYRSESYSGVSTGKHLRIWKRGNDGRLKIQFLISAYDD